MQQKEEKKLVRLYGVDYWAVPEEYYNSCHGCQFGTNEECRIRESNSGTTNTGECSDTHTIYKIAEIALGKKKRLEL